MRRASGNQPNRADTLVNIMTFVIKMKHHTVGGLTVQKQVIKEQVGDRQYPYLLLICLPKVVTCCAIQEGNTDYSWVIYLFFEFIIIINIFLIKIQKCSFKIKMSCAEKSECLEFG